MISVHVVKLVIMEAIAKTFVNTFEDVKLKEMLTSLRTCVHGCRQVESRKLDLVSVMCLRLLLGVCFFLTNDVRAFVHVS